MSTIFSCSTQLRCHESQVETFLARPRNTPSALAMNSRMAAQVASELAASQLLASDGTPLATAPSGAEQLRAIFCGLETLRQDQVRLLAYQRIVLEAKMAAMLERLEGRSEWGAEEGDLDMGTGGSEALQRLQRAVVDNQAELLRAVGLPTTRAILRAIWAPDMQEALKLSIMSEEESRDKLASTHDEYLTVTALQESGMENLRGGSISTRGASNLYQAQERAARLWRRRLWKITIPVRIDAKLRWATAHDDYDHKGNRSLANHLNRHNPDNNLSYYQLQAKTYGGASGRRGSTTVSGLFQQVLAQERTRAYEAGEEVSENAFYRAQQQRLESEQYGGGGGGGGGGEGTAAAAAEGAHYQPAEPPSHAGMQQHQHQHLPLPQPQQRQPPTPFYTEATLPAFQPPRI